MGTGENSSEMTLQLVVDCADPQRLARFWAIALRYVLEPAPGGFATWRAYWLDQGVPAAELPEGAGETAESVVDPKGVGPRVWFQAVPEPKTVKNRLHLDLKVGGGRTVPLPERRRRVTAEVARLTQAGASVLRTTDAPEADHYGVLMQDPEGNEFCVA